MLIDKPGVFSATMDEYQADPCPEPSVSSSHAKALLTDSPGHAWWASRRMNPEWEPSEKTAFDIGTAVHTLLTGVGEPIVVLDHKSFQTKAAQEERDAARADGKTPLLAKDWDRTRKMVERARIQLACGPYGDPFDHDPLTCEVNAAWQQGGVWNRIRADKLNMEERLIFDLKTTASAAEPSLDRRILDLQWDVSAAHYLDGVQMIFGPGWRMVFVVVEAKPPHGLRLLELPGDWIALGQDKLQMAREKHRRCLDRFGETPWPMYPVAPYRPELRQFIEDKHVLRRDAERAADKPGKSLLDASARWQGPVAAA